jgi:hypothetical protein
LLDDNDDGKLTKKKQDLVFQAWRILFYTTAEFPQLVDNNQRYLCRRLVSRESTGSFGEGFVMVETLDTALQIV